MPLSLRWHLLGLVLAALLPVLIFSAATMYQLGEGQRGNAEAEISSAAGSLAEDVDVELQSWISALEILAASSPLTDSDLLSFYYLAQRVRQNQKWANIVLTGPNGEHLMNLRAPYGTRLPPLNRPDVFINAARTGRPYVSNVVPGLLAGQSLTVVTMPIFRDDRVEYVMAAALSASTWESFLRSRLPARAQAVLLDREGSIISRTYGGPEGAGKKAMPALLDAMKQNPERGKLQGASLEGTESFATYVRAPFSGWTVSVAMPLSEIEGPVSASLAKLGAGFALLLALGLGLAWMFARRIGTAIEELAASVRAVGDGFEPLPVRERITEVQQAEVALKDAAALLAERLRREQAARAEVEAADRAKDRFLATLSHELRNPLAPISAALFLLNEGGGSEEESRSARGVIGRQLQHLTRLVDDLLDVTRIGSGKVELRREPVSLNETLRRAYDDHTGIAARAGIALELDLPREDLQVHGDPTRLGQIVGNLLQNGFRFTPEGGRVTVSLARRGNVGEIHVRDNGVGIDEQMIPHLFEPFFQIPKGGARNAGGLGLGLPLVKGFAELHGGSVQVFSAGRGKGAEIVVTLPLRY